MSIDCNIKTLKTELKRVKSIFYVLRACVDGKFPFFIRKELDEFKQKMKSEGLNPGVLRELKTNDATMENKIYYEEQLKMLQFKEKMVDVTGVVIKNCENADEKIMVLLLINKRLKLFPRRLVLRHILYGLFEI